ncbi:MAG: malate dehydrogenase [Candidatus Bathyarchaeia archaeon]|jgi:malate dehydrogenase
MISIIGAGKVGSAAAFAILRYKISDVTLIDVFEDLAKGEAMDLMQAAPEIEFDGKIIGSNNFEDMKGSELVIVTAGQGRKPGMTRTDLLNINAKIIADITKEVAKYAPEAKLMMVTNPVDALTYVAYKTTGFPRNQVFGMGNILDAMRFRTYLAQQCGVSREDTRALVIGEHGETMVPLVEYASISGIPVKEFMTQEMIDTAVCQTVTSGQEVIALKGATTFAPSTVIAVMADAVLSGRNRVLSATTPLEGEYGLSGLSIGVPVILGKNGIERILELDLSPESKERLDLSANNVKEALKTLGLA